jgi:hypothetical protein
MVGEVMGFIDGKTVAMVLFFGGGKGVFEALSKVSGCYVIMASDSCDSFRVIRRRRRQEG